MSTKQTWLSLNASHYCQTTHERKKSLDVIYCRTLKKGVQAPVHVTVLLGIYLWIAFVQTWFGHGSVKCLEIQIEKHSFGTKMRSEKSQMIGIQLYWRFSKEKVVYH